MVEFVREVLEPLLPLLDEKARRLAAGALARALGHGGIAAVARASGLMPDTVSDGVRDLEPGAVPGERLRRPGAGRKSAAEVDPGLVPALLALVEPTRRGDPDRPLAWTTLSTRDLAGELTAAGHRIGHSAVGKLLRENGFVLRGNAKVLEGMQHPDRDGQFRHINDTADDYLAAGDPVVSIDAKKKELIGNFANAGRTWQPADDPVRVRDHDFPARDQQVAIPFGIYDLAANAGWVNVGVDHNTAAFAVESLRRWWIGAGRHRYPDARRLLITCDAGGANAATSRLFKAELHAFAFATGLVVAVCHFPPGTSKWNKIEHRLFSAITHNWRGRPLESLQVVVDTIAATTTETGLQVTAEVDTGTYPLGREYSKTEFAGLPLDRDDWHGEWNYSLRPVPGPPPRPVAQDKHPAWVHPDLLGLDPDAFAAILAYTSAARATTPLDRRTTTQRAYTASGRHSKLTRADELLLTMLRHRYRLRMADLGALFGTDRGHTGRIIATTDTLLANAGHTIPAPPADHNPPTTPQEFTIWADTLTHAQPPANT